MNATAVDEKRAHLLIKQRNGFAIIERRTNCLYNCRGGKRDGIAAE